MKIALASSAKAQVHAVGCFESEQKTHRTLIGSKKFEGACGQMIRVFEKGSLVLLVGLGKKQNYSLQCLRKSLAKISVVAKAEQASSVSVDLDSFFGDLDAGDCVQAAVEGARLSDYTFTRYKSKPAAKSSLTSLTLVSRKKTAELQKALKVGEIISEAVCFTRDIANEPANVINPESLAKAAQAMARKSGLRCTILGPTQIKKLGMGGILGVSQGSMYEPRLVILENKVSSSKKPIVFVGKGVTFDTGGISIKPSNDMDKMKFDMSGAAAVIGAMKAIGELKLKVKCVGITPLVENMPGSKAMRPGDIIRFMNGKTAEVLNTDAEGRLILADALCYAKRYNPSALIDIATLTGACAATFADVCSALMTTDAELGRQLEAVGQTTGERLWQLPLWDEYFDLIKATYADIQNISKKYAGTITAGMFLKEFADHTTHWAHLDVAGTAWADSPKPLGPIGNTGIGVRWFVEFARRKSA